MTGDVALKACPFCGEVPSRILGCKDRYAHSWDSKCWLAGKQFTLEQWDTRSPVCEDARKELVEAAAKVADKHVQRARKAVAECKSWSPAQAEWSRARDLGLDIADDIRALAKSLPSLQEPAT